jgi:hypothetical protein
MRRYFIESAMKFPKHVKNKVQKIRVSKICYNIFTSGIPAQTL